VKFFGGAAGIVADIGGTALFFKELMRTLFKKPCRAGDVVDQTWKVTFESLPTTAMAGFFVGAIMAVQFTLQMRDFGALGYLGGLATSATVR
jgi:phospholipid/cholesterol/gamma-HCH transport system permease protein